MGSLGGFRISDLVFRILAAAKGRAKKSVLFLLPSRHRGPPKYFPFAPRPHLRIIYPSFLRNATRRTVGAGFALGGAGSQITVSFLRKQESKTGKMGFSPCCSRFWSFEDLNFDIVPPGIPWRISDFVLRISDFLYTNVRRRPCTGIYYSSHCPPFR